MSCQHFWGDCSFWSLLAENGAQRGPFLGPAWIQNGSKIAFLSIDRRLDPPKMTSERRFGKSMKMWWKIDANIEGFWWLRTTFGVILFAYFTFLPFSEKSKNQCKKECQKLSFLVQKPTLKDRGSIESAVLVDFWGFGKSLFFRCRFGSSKNR